jgi:ABC-type spermidine/putrescine transport system permease subunit II
VSDRTWRAVAVEEAAPGRVAVPAEIAVRRKRPPKAFDQPRFLTVFTIVVFLYFFAPIFVVLLFSFNSLKSLAIFRSFSLTWYQQFLADPDIQASLTASIEIALVTMVAATVLGTMLAFALLRARTRAKRPTDSVMILNLVSPEIATAVALLLVFSQLGFTLSVATVMLGHITFSIAYVTIIVRGRMASLNKETEEAALDLGATPVQAVRLVTLPLLWPAIVASAMLVFVMSFDDFVTSFFLSGADVSPLPVRIYSMIRNGVTPEINAVGTVMMVLTGAVVILAFFVYSARQGKKLELATTA